MPATSHEPAARDKGGFLAGTCVVLATAAAYAGSLRVPFLFDDIPSIVENPTIRHLASSLSPAADTTVSGRPLVNLSLALDHALGGDAPYIYHATNLAIHILSALLLLGIVRRTLAGKSAAALPIAFCAALLWALHPLNTESVTYVIQRAESLMGLLYLATLYSFIRGSTGGGRAWYAFSVACCFLGMAAKEAMASAPLVVLLYDRTFLAGTFRGALALRWRIHGALAASWLLLGCLVFSTHGRTGTVGFGGAISSLDYARTQASAIGHYLRLAFWPEPLVFDYGRTLVTKMADILPGLLVVAALASATLWALLCRPALGFLGACFFLLLAPSSSFVPVLTETVAEHRMYLPLIPVAVAVALAINRWLPRALLPMACALAVFLLACTWHRNETYGSDEAIWRSVTEALPANERAHNNLGYVLASKPGGLDEAVAQYRLALELDPAYAQAHLNLARALVREPGGLREAISEFKRALAVNPTLVDAHYNLGCALMATPAGVDEAATEFQYALRLKPDFAEAHYNLGCALGAMPGRTSEAIEHYREAIRLKPWYPEAHFNLGCALVQIPGRIDDAIGEFKATLGINHRYVPALCNLALALGSVGRTREAIARARDAVAIEPDNAAAREILHHLDAVRN